MTFNNQEKIFFVKNLRFIKVNLHTHACFRRNCKLSLILTLWTKFKDLLHTFNVYKIPAKEHKVVYRWSGHEISVSEIMFLKYLENVPLILCNSKKVNRKKIVIFTIYSFLNAQYILMTTAESISEEPKSVRII